MGRGGIGARRARADRVTKSNRYALTGVPRGTRVAACLDRYGRWELGYRTGIIFDRVGQRIYVLWDDDSELEVFADGDARYLVDTNRWRLTGPTPKTVFDAMSSGHKRSELKGQDALTRLGKDESMSISPQLGAETEGEQNMSDTLSAKQVATRLGTDAKTFRRFLRSNNCTVDPVGQGGRYEFEASDLEALTAQFTKWRKPGAKTSGNTTAPAKKLKKAAPKKQIVEDDDEPSEDELADIEDELEDLDFSDLEV